MIGRALGLPLGGTLHDLLTGGDRQIDLPATPELGRQMQVGYALLAALTVPIVLATAGAHLGPGINYIDVVTLCAAYGLFTIGLLGVPWQRFHGHWSLVAVALPIVYVASLSALTGGGSSPYTAVYAPVLGIAGWYLPLRYVGATLALVVATEVWRAVALDGSRSVEQLAIMLPFGIAVAVAAWMSSTWLHRSLTHTRLEQIQMANALEAIQNLGVDPANNVLSELVRALERVFDASGSVVRLDMERSATDAMAPIVRAGNEATILVAGTTRFHGLVTLKGERGFSANELRLAQMLAEAAGRTLDAREAGPVDGDLADSDFRSALFRIADEPVGQE
jgi:hypothetical protein